MTISYISTLKTSIEKESVSIEFRPIEIDETRNYTLEEIKCNGLMSEKHNKLCRTLNSFRHFLAFVSTVSRCVLISEFASLVGIPVGIASSAVAK